MDDAGMPPEVRAAFVVIKRVYERMVAQGMSREAIEAAIHTWMLRGMAHAGVEMAPEQTTYYLTLTLRMLEANTPEKARRLAALLHRAYECN